MANATTFKGTEGKQNPSAKDDKGMMGQAMDAASSAATAVKDKAQDVASAVGEKAKDFASNVGERAKEFATGFGDKAEGAVSSVGHGFQSVADTIRSKGPQEGVMGQATSAVAGALGDTGHYLEEQGLSGMADDITKMIRRNPIPAILLGIGVGFMIARMSSRS